jgi:23S rRNA pseudouridine2605 synthase
LAALKAGVPTALGVLGSGPVEILGYVGPRTRLKVELEEGKNRHLRRVFGALKDDLSGRPLKVLDLKRIQVGPIALDSLASGRWRRLEPEEEAGLRSAV